MLGVKDTVGGSTMEEELGNLSLLLFRHVFCLIDEKCRHRVHLEAVGLLSIISHDL